MRPPKLLLVIFALMMFIPQPAIAFSADIVTVSGYVNDTRGKPVANVVVTAFEEGNVVANTNTDNAGHYTVSVPRPKRIEPPAFPRFFKGRPIYEPVDLSVGYPAVEGQWTVVNDISTVIDTEGKSSIRKDFVLQPAGVLKLRAYGIDGTQITTFDVPGGVSQYSEDPVWPSYTTDLDWRVLPSTLVRDRMLFLVPLNTTVVLNLPWEVPGFGKVVLRADNGGEGFRFKERGETTSINLNYEFARTETGLLIESYRRYVDAGYRFTDDLPLRIQVADELLKMATGTTSDAQKARLAYPCINSTLWAGEVLEYERAQQDIEKYRKGNASLVVIDEHGKPASDVNVTVTQVTHDFLFGVSREGPLDLHMSQAIFEQGPDAHLQTKIGMNFVNLQFWWSSNEPVPGQYDFSVNPLEVLRHLKEIGVRMGGEGLISLEPGFETWGTGLMNLDFDELRARIHDHVELLVSRYAEYVDYWIVYTNPHKQMHSLGFTRDQVMELIRIGVQTVKEFDPTSQVLVFFGDPDGSTVSFEGSDDKFSADPYTFFSLFKDHDIHNLGMSLMIVYGAVHEFPPDAASQIQAGPNKRIHFDFRDLGSISRIFDWYNTLSAPIHITDFFASGRFSTQLGYWHTRTWDEALKTEWIERFYTVAFSKPQVKQITYWDSVDQDFMTTEPGLLDAHYAPRESFYALKKLITEEWTTRLKAKTDENGRVDFRGFAGNYTVTIRTKNGAFNSSIHVNEQANQSFIINLGKANAEHAITKAAEAVSKAKTEGRTILLDKAESLLQDARKALSHENYAEAMLLAGQANIAADNAVTWLVMPIVVVFAVGVISIAVVLCRRAKRPKA